MRIQGRLLRPSTLAERRLLLGYFGMSCIRVPRSQNPFVWARRLRRVAVNQDIASLKAIVGRNKNEPILPPVSPDVDVPEPLIDEYAAAE